MTTLLITLSNDMRTTWEVIFCVGLCWLAYVYAGYPVALWLLGYAKRYKPAPTQGTLPTVSVLISARNEERDIDWKIAETLAWDYPAEKLELLVASDDSDDHTDDILKKVSDPRFRYIRLEPRQGKNEALNRLAALAHGEVLFFSDANSHIEPTCLRKMVRHFADRRVGCVTGYEHTTHKEGETVVGTGWKAFLNIESRITLLESRIGSVLTCDGSIFCIRRELYTVVTPELANDLEIPIRIGSQGWKLLYEPTAISMEAEIQTIREDFARRRRICSQGFLGMLKLRKSLSGLRLWQFTSRKLLRWLTLLPLLGLLVSSACLASRPMFSIILGVQGFFYLCALLGWFFASRLQNATGMFTLPFYFLLVNVAAMIGVIDACLGRRFSVWEIAKLSRRGKIEQVVG